MRWSCLLCCCLALGAAELADDIPQVIQVGAGSYASRPPRDQNRRPWLQGKEGWGDESQVYSNMRLYVDPQHQGPVPSTDWWTSLVSRRWSGDLWAYPAVVKAQPQGVELRFPKHWQGVAAGKRAEFEATSSLLVSAVDFAPQHAEAVSWGDWSLRFRLPAADGKAIEVTTAHGMPCTWFEFQGCAPLLTIGEAQFFGGDATRPLGRIGLQLGEDHYGLHLPAGSRLERQGSQLRIHFTGKARYLVLSVLPDAAALAAVDAQARCLPRQTELRWDYDPAAGAVATTWHVTVEDLAGTGADQVLQGWIPHHYRAPSRPAFAADGLRYVTPRGELRCAVGNDFRITFPFTGLLPAYPAARPAQGRPELMQALVREHLARPGYGSDSYWGGKRVLLHARYMEMARQLGMADELAVFEERAAEAVRDWLTFTPGEAEHFFAWYPNWGSFVACRSRDNANPGVDVLQDHHMCYGYHVYAAALLAMNDPAFARDWGPMAGLMARDYAEWDAASPLFGRFRNLDPWCGHSWSGGMGGDQGNGQESSSEAMQGYGAMYLLGAAIGDDAMRDAAALCWAMEARGIAAYYFDREHSNFPPGWPHTVVSNLHTEGIGFWTWFSGNPFWMHAIQWLPMSPLLSYLGEDLAYARADFERMWQTHEGGQGWNGYLGRDTGVSNIAMNYLATFDATEALRVFHELRDSNRGGANGAEAGPTYWRHLALNELGPHRFDAWCDAPLAQVFGPDEQHLAWVAFNPTDDELTVRCFLRGQQVDRFTVPPRRMATYRNGRVELDGGTMPPVGPMPSDEPSLPLSEGCAVTASSQQGNLVAANAVDGDPETRWASRASDDEWLAVDLGRRCRVTGVELRWEAAFGRDYDIELSDDGHDWRTVYERRGGTGGSETLVVDGSGRHLRLRGRKRGTDWGWSLFNLAVLGEAEEAGGGRLVIEPALALVHQHDDARFAAFLEAEDGTRQAVAATWQAEGGTIDANGRFTPSRGGTFATPRFAITASAAGKRARSWAVVEEARRVGQLVVSPDGGSAGLRLAVGQRLSLQIEARDQFGARIAQAPQVAVSGGITFADGIVTATALGQAALRISLGGEERRVSVTVCAPEEIDIAPQARISTSSAVGGNTGDKACDLDPKSRWESAAADPQWLALDFGQAMPVRRIELYWERARAKHYRIEASDDGSSWRTVAEERNARGGQDQIVLPKTITTRHLRLHCLERATGYGNSLFTLAVYGGP